jgi:hypothetical protein
MLSQHSQLTRMQVEGSEAMVETKADGWGGQANNSKMGGKNTIRLVSTINYLTANQTASKFRANNNSQA